MSFLSSLIAWANVPFTVALGVAVVFALLQVTGILGLLAGGGEEGDADGDADGHANVDGHADAGGHADGSGDADGHADADGDGDADGDHEGEHQHAGGGHGLGHQILIDLGVGKVPLSIVWQTYAVCFAFAGIAANTLYLSRVGALPPVTLAWTLPFSLLFGYFTTKLTARSLGRLVANPDEEATTRKALVGQSGVVISSKVNGEFGEVRVKDKTGHVLRIICRTREDEKPIVEGREVVIVDYDRSGDRLYVAPLDDGDDEPSPRGSTGQQLR